MALVFIIRHVMMTVLFSAMTSQVTVSRTYQVKVNSTGSRVCAVDTPSIVIQMVASTMGGRCGGECNMAPSCRLHQFKENLAQCELFYYLPKNFSALNHCTAYAPIFRPTHVCQVSALSWGNYDYNRNNGYITAGSNSISTNFAGFTIALLNVESCSLSTPRSFNTNSNRTQSMNMASYLQSLPMSTVLVGTTSAEASNSLESTARAALQSIGVNIDGFSWRWKVVFLAQIGRPAMTVFKIASARSGNQGISVVVRSGAPLTSDVSFN